MSNPRKLRLARLLERVSDVEEGHARLALARAALAREEGERAVAEARAQEHSTAEDRAALAQGGTEAATLQLLDTSLDACRARIAAAQERLPPLARAHEKARDAWTETRHAQRRAARLRQRLGGNRSNSDGSP